jgi:1,4-dihydroxy-2-naphthoyl-CoA synthase
MALLLQEKLDECASLHEIRSVYITGAGKAFSAGQDLGELAGENAISIDIILSEHYNPVIKRIRNLPKPVVAAVNGVAAGRRGQYGFVLRYSCCFAICFIFTGIQQDRVDTGQRRHLFFTKINWLAKSKRLVHAG